ncbi:gamma-mobile-trio protein GmtX [Escherichia coli]|nr:gamma-mobile-trio protein GmtX [Escherichia coli]MEA1097442.1 gamma-mobile-trio protein GmtX [Escherichia coli]
MPVSKSHYPVPPGPKSVSRRLYSFLERIPDLAVRALFGQIIAERNRYRNEVKSAQTTYQYHHRQTPRAAVSYDTRYLRWRYYRPLSGILTHSERKPWRIPISEECMDKNNWQITQAGQVKDTTTTVKFFTEVLSQGFESYWMWQMNNGNGYVKPSHIIVTISPVWREKIHICPFSSVEEAGVERFVRR